MNNKIAVFIESKYPAKRKSIRKTAVDVLKENKIISDVELSISIVGDRKIAKLNKQYRNKDRTTPVLSFQQRAEDKFPESLDNVIRLGDVIVSYPQARELAKQENKLVDEVIKELVEHGVRKLLSI